MSEVVAFYSEHSFGELTDPVDVGTESHFAAILRSLEPDGVKWLFIDYSGFEPGFLPFENVAILYIDELLFGALHIRRHKAVGDVWAVELSPYQSLTERVGFVFRKMWDPGGRRRRLTDLQSRLNHRIASTISKLHLGSNVLLVARTEFQKRAFQLNHTVSNGLSQHKARCESWRKHST